MLNFKVQRIAGIYPWLDRLYCPTSLQKGSGTFAKTQTIQLPSLYAHRSVMQRRRQVAAAGGAPGVLRGHTARAGVPTSRVKAPRAEPLVGGSGGGSSLWQADTK